MGCHFLLQGIFLTKGSNPHLLCLLHCRRILYQLTYQGSPSVAKMKLYVNSDFFGRNRTLSLQLNSVCSEGLVCRERTSDSLCSVHWLQLTQLRHPCTPEHATCTPPASSPPRFPAAPALLLEGMEEPAPRKLSASCRCLSSHFYSQENSLMARPKSILWFTVNSTLRRSAWAYKKARIPFCFWVVSFFFLPLEKACCCC